MDTVLDSSSCAGLRCHACRIGVNVQVAALLSGLPCWNEAVFEIRWSVVCGEQWLVCLLQLNSQALDLDASFYHHMEIVKSNTESSVDLSRDARFYFELSSRLFRFCITWM